MPTLKVKDEPPSGPRLKVKDTQQDAPPPLQTGAETLPEESPAKFTPPPSQKPQKRVKQTKPDQQELPHSVEAELGVLSSILIDFQFSKSSRVISEVAGKINPFHFYVPAHKTTYEMFLSLWKAEAPIDLISFTEILREKGLLEGIGGPAFITNLINYVPTSAAVAYYCDIMLEQARRREMISIGSRMVRAAYGAHEEDSIELLRSFEGSIVRLRENTRDPALVDVSTMLNGHRPPIPRLIVQHLLHQGSKMIIGGGSKARKTWGLMDLALSVATGTDWWGFHTYKNRVCYINLELQDAFFAERMERLCQQKEVQPEPGWFEVLNLRGRVETVESLRQKYTPFLKAGFFRLLLIDPSYKLLGGRDENSAGEIATLLNEFEKIANDIDAAVAFASHYSKGNQALKEFMDRIGGSGVFARDPDVVMTMTQHEDADCFTVEARCRNLMSPSPFVVRWEHPLFMRDDEKSPDKLKGKVGAQQVWVEKDILDEFRVADDGWKAAKLQKRLHDERGMSSATFYRLWEGLKKESKIRVDQDGLWHKKSTLTVLSDSSESNESNPLSEPF